MLAGSSVIRSISQVNDEPPNETIIIKRCKMPELATEFTDDELEKIISDLENFGRSIDSVQ